MEIMELFFTPDEDLYDKPITDFFDDEVLKLQLLAVLAYHVRLLRIGIQRWK
mgnify:CR=1 FL=1